MEDWLKDHEHTIEFWSKVTTLVVAVGGIWLTVSQLSQAKDAVVFANEYNIYKDGRDLLKLFIDDPQLYRSLNVDDINKVAEQNRDKVRAQIGTLLNFYSFTLGKRGEDYMSSDLRQRLIDDFCQLVRLPLVAARLTARNPNEPYFLLTTIKRDQCRV
jgi:hypothetical protein